MKRQIINGLSLLSCGLVLAACMDDSYDLGQDIDMTMQLGSEGLAVKLGNTERIYMKDILEVEDGNNLDTTRTGLYYVEQGDATDFEFKVDPVTTSLDKTQLRPEIEDVITFDKIVNSVPAPSSATSVYVPRFEITLPGVEASDNHHVRLNGISSTVKSIKAVELDDESVRLSLEIVDESLGQYFKIKKVDNLVINIPEYLKCSGATKHLRLEGQKLVLKGPIYPDDNRVDLGTAQIDRVQFNGELGQPLTNENFELAGTLSIKCDLELASSEGFTAKAGDYVNVQLYFDVGDKDGVVRIAQASGVFDPEIDPDIQPIDLGNFLPGFLKDDGVKVDVENPTVRFEADMTEIPASINVKAHLTSSKVGGESKTVWIPDEANQVTLKKGGTNLFYFCPENRTPFVPDAAESDLQGNKETLNIRGLNEFIEILPDEIAVDLGKGNTNLKQGELNTIQFDHTYTARLKYDLFIPFHFGRDLKIVYTDTIADLNADLQDLEADGILLTANILNTVPLQLNATLIPVDTDGREIPTIEISPATIAAGNETGVNTALEIAVKFTNRSDLRKLDKIIFKVTAAAQGSDMLSSRQYFQVRDVRLKLTGPVIADLND